MAAGRLPCGGKVPRLVCGWLGCGDGCGQRLALTSPMAGTVPACRAVRAGKEAGVRFTGYCFGSVRVDDVTYDHDLIIDRGKIRRRKKGASRKFRDTYGHTPLSAAEDIPWRCRRLVIGTGADGCCRS
jgi:hypothetical protein